MIPAAGSGKRMRASQNKLFLQLGDRPILAHTLQRFQEDEWCESIIVAIKEDERLLMEAIAKKFNLSKITQFVVGGAERQHSVHACLEAYDGTSESIVLVHDAARPFIHESTIHDLVMKANETGAAIAAVKVQDTTKVVVSDIVQQTLPREQLWAIQTPQAFRYELLYNASKEALEEQFEATDESMVVERYGAPVHIVESTYDNIKMTTTADLSYGHYLLKERGELR